MDSHYFTKEFKFQSQSLSNDMRCYQQNGVYKLSCILHLTSVSPGRFITNIPHGLGMWLSSGQTCWVTHFKVPALLCNIFLVQDVQNVNTHLVHDVNVIFNFLILIYLTINGRSSGCFSIMCYIKGICGWREKVSA